MLMKAHLFSSLNSINKAESLVSPIIEIKNLFCVPIMSFLLISAVSIAAENIMVNIINIIFFIRSSIPLTTPVVCEHNNWLYRRQLDCLSATNLCYDKNITYTELYCFYNFCLAFIIL